MHTDRVTPFAALSDPTRVRIVELLAESGELPAGKIAEHFSMTRAGVSRHLRLLEDAGFVAVREEAQRRLYRVNPVPLEEIDAWIDRYRGMWEAKLQSLHKQVGGKR